MERAYIEALSKRYSNEKGADRKALDRAYAGAMRELSKRYPDDADAATLYAAALMNLRPWNYWGKDGRPYAGTMKFVSTLESVLEREPLHPGANHYYIHAVEATATPQRALRSAERLGRLMPGAGHLVHMPAHIYLRVGRYAAASESNVRAIEADEDYITQCRVQSLYPLQYYPHNIHFLWASATMEGRSAVAIRSARQVASKVPPVNAKGLLPFEKVFPLIPLFALTRFGQWEAILTEPVPPADHASGPGTLALRAGNGLHKNRKIRGSVRGVGKVVSHPAGFHRGGFSGWVNNGSEYFADRNGSSRRGACGRAG